mgnify:CR=1 FL=1
MEGNLNTLFTTFSSLTGTAMLISAVVNAGKKTALLNAYPPRYFHGIDSGRRLYSSVPLALTNAGFPLFTQDDLYAGRALSAEELASGAPVAVLGTEALSVFFPNGDASQAPQASDPKHKSWILNEVGLCLMNLGRLREAAPFYERGTSDRDRLTGP